MQLCSFTTAAAAAITLGVFAGQASADISAYSQDFEALDQTGGSALSDDGWVVGANVFAPGGGPNGEGGYLYGYFAFPAPNGGPAFSGVTETIGSTVPDGAQGLTVYNDYNNPDHGNGSNNRIEAIFFREYTVGAADVGKTWEFSFLAAPGNLGGSSTAHAFIKTLDPGAGFAASNLVSVDTHTIPAGNSAFELELLITSDLVGHVFQVGFDNWASNFEDSGVNYDNVVLQEVVPEPGSLALLGLGALAMLRRRRHG